MRLIAIACLAGCGVTDFDITQPIPEQRITGNPLPGPLGALFQVPLNVDISSQIQAMHTGPIGSVTLSSLELTITPTAQPMGDWSFVDKIDVFVARTMSGSPLPKVKIAHITSPGKVTTMHFAIDGGVNLKPYVEEGSQVDGQSSGRAPPNDVTYDGQGVFTVHPL